MPVGRYLQLSLIHLSIDAVIVKGEISVTGSLFYLFKGCRVDLWLVDYTCSGEVLKEWCLLVAIDLQTVEPFLRTALTASLDRDINDRFFARIYIS